VEGTVAVSDAPLPARAGVRFRDLSVPEGPLRAGLRAAFERVLDHGMLLMGPEVEAFESTFAAYCGVGDCIGVASGTSALYLALRALGIGPGDEVITTAMSWIATANAIAAAGAVPVFADIGDDLNIDAETIPPLLTTRTRAILPVHYTGRLCDMQAIGAIASANGLRVIEDAAQAAGARTAAGRHAGSFGHAGAFSLNPMKLLPGYGEAGAVVTSDPELRPRIEAMRYLGTVDREICHEVELNHKMDALQAAFLIEGMKCLPQIIERRQQIAARYAAGLADVVACPSLDGPEGSRPVFFDFTVEVAERDRLREALAGAGIETKIRHPILMCDQPAYRHLPPTPVPRARQAVARILSLPIHEKMSDPEVDRVIAAIRKFHDAG